MAVTLLTLTNPVRFCLKHDKKDHLMIWMIVDRGWKVVLNASEYQIKGQETIVFRRQQKENFTYTSEQAVTLKQKS